MINGGFGFTKLHTINRRAFIIGVAKIIVFSGIVALVIFITNYRK